VKTTVADGQANRHGAQRQNPRTLLHCGSTTLAPGNATYSASVASAPPAAASSRNSLATISSSIDHADVLTWTASSVEMNPTLPDSIVEKARVQDTAAAAREWDAEFRSDLETFLSAELIAARVDDGCHERPP
jgi:hypothetical protein